MTIGHKYNFKIFLACADVAALAASLQLAGWIRYDLNPAGLFTTAHAPWVQMYQVLPWLALVWLFVLRFTGMYRLGRGPADELLGLAKSVLLTFLLVLAAIFFYRSFSFSRSVVLLMIPIVFVLTSVARFGARFIWDRVLRLEAPRGEALLIGSGPIAEHLARACATPRCDYTLAGVLTGSEQTGSVAGLPRLGSPADLPGLLRTGRYNTVLVADGKLDHEAHLEIAECCMRYGCQYHVVPDIYELMLSRVQVNMVGGLPLLGLKGSNLTGVNYLMKRIFDLVVSGMLLVGAGPVMLISAAAIKLSSKGPVLFKQERVGLHGRTFNVLKFRSMHQGDDTHVRDYVQKWIGQEAPATSVDGEALYKVSDDARVFPFGAFMRRFSIDELPQLINVLRGDMSLIGPRPPVPYEVEVYREWHRRRFEALPGITGLWQVSGRNRLSFDEMVKLDIEYIENWSVELDLKIAFRTVGEVFSGGGY